MGCETIDLGGGAYVIVCTRGRRRSPKACKVCLQPRATKLCDFPLKGKAAGKTCDADLCDRCAVSMGPDRDYCPAHAKQQTLPGLP